MMFFIKFIIIFSVFRPITVLLHEIGHAIPALLFTKDKVTLFIGSFGNTDSSINLKFGRLNIVFKRNPFLWKLGLCKMHAQKIAVTHNFIVVLAGPLTSLLLAILFCYLAFYTGLDDTDAFLSFIFLFSSLHDFFIDIVPDSQPIILDDGSITHNDGQNLKMLWKYRNLPEEYTIGAKHYDKKEYKLAAISFEQVLNTGYRKDFIYQLLISAYLQIKDTANASRVNKLFSSKLKKSFNSNDYTNSGLIKSFTEEYDEAIKDYNKAIEMDSTNSVALNNRGYTYNLMEDYESALKDFKKSISIDKDFAYALNNRGFSKIKLGFKKQGLVDLKKSMTLDGTNSYCYLNFGIYHYDKGEYQKASDFFKKAKELDPTTHMLQSYIKKVQEKLSPKFLS